MDDDDSTSLAETSETSETSPMVGTSLRLPADLLAWAKEEASICGLDSWSQLVRQLLEAERTRIADDVPVTISVNELMRAILEAAHRRSDT